MCLGTAYSVSSGKKRNKSYNMEYILIISDFIQIDKHSFFIQYIDIHFQRQFNWVFKKGVKTLPQKKSKQTGFLFLKIYSPFFSGLLYTSRPGVVRDDFSNRFKRSLRSLFPNSLEKCIKFFKCMK